MKLKLKVVKGDEWEGQLLGIIPITKNVKWWVCQRWLQRLFGKDPKPGQYTIDYTITPFAEKRRKR